MSIVHWILLILVIVVVGGAYWYLRRHNGTDPWQGMDDPEEGDAGKTGVSLGGDSYIVGVRTLSPENVGKAGVGQSAGARSDAEAEAAWSAFKTASESQQAQRSEREPAVQSDDAAVTETEATQPATSAATQTTATAHKPDRDEAESRPAGTQQSQPATAEDDGPAPPTVAARVENIRPVRPPAGEERIFMLHIAARDGARFDGPDIHAALDAEGLKFGLHDFYHRVTDANGEIESVYSVANMLKPGVLDPVDQDHLRTPGLTMFLILPGAIEGVRAMRDMMETANAIARQLGGQVLDDKRSLLNAQTAQYMLDEIVDIDRRARLRKAR